MPFQRIRNTPVATGYTGTADRSIRGAAKGPPKKTTSVLPVWVNQEVLRLFLFVKDSETLHEYFHAFDSLNCGCVYQGCAGRLLERGREGRLPVA